MAVIEGELTSIEEKTYSREGQEDKLYFLLTLGNVNKQTVTVWEAEQMANVKLHDMLKITYEQKGAYKNSTKIDIIGKAPKIDFSGVKIEDASEVEKKRGMTEGSEFDKEFIVSIKGKKFVRFNGLLDKATRNGLISMVITETKVSESGDSAYCVGYVEFENGKKVFMTGSANKDTLKEHLKGYAVEMAATRMFARALRNSLNVDFVSVEEMKDVE